MADFVVLATADWDHPLWTNKQHTALTLAAAGHRVLYVESLGIRPPRVGVPLPVAELKLRRCREHHIHRLRQRLFTGFNASDRHAGLILDAVNAVIDAARKALRIEIPRGEWVVGPEDRVGEPQPPANNLEPPLKKPAVEAKRPTAVTTRQDRGRPNPKPFPPLTRQLQHAPQPPNDACAIWDPRPRRTNPEGLDIEHTVSSSGKRQRRVLLVGPQLVIPVGSGEDNKIRHCVSIGLDQCHLAKRRRTLLKLLKITTGNDFAIGHLINQIALFDC